MGFPGVGKLGNISPDSAAPRLAWVVVWLGSGFARVGPGGGLAAGAKSILTRGVESRLALPSWAGGLQTGEAEDFEIWDRGSLIFIGLESLQVGIPN